MLLREPNTLISVHVLEDAHEGVRKKRKEGADTGPIVDKKGRKKLKKQLQDIEEDLERTKRLNDPNRTDKLNEEKSQIIEQLTKSMSPHHGPRKTGHPTEKARKAVTSDIKYALNRIEEIHKPLAGHLINSITTGKHCLYRPEKPTRWEL